MKINALFDTSTASGLMWRHFLIWQVNFHGKSLISSFFSIYWRCPLLLALLFLNNRLIFNLSISIQYAHLQNLWQLLHMENQDFMYIATDEDVSYLSFFLNAVCQCSNSLWQHSHNPPCHFHDRSVTCLQCYEICNIASYHLNLASFKTLSNSRETLLNNHLNHKIILHHDSYPTFVLTPIPPPSSLILSFYHMNYVNLRL